MKYILAFLCVFATSRLIAQSKIIKGTVKDSHSGEYLPFASIQFKNTGVGNITDSSGAFSFRLSRIPSDTLVISSISYQTLYLPIPHNRDTVNLTISLQPGSASAEVIVKAKTRHSRGWYLWKKVVLHRDQNNIFSHDNFTYNVYNRLEVDLNNVNKEKIKKNFLLKRFGFISNSIDSSSEEKPFLPSFFSESLSDYYYQKNPRKTRELIRAAKITGVKNESITKYMGALYQNVVIYHNFIPVFDKQFVSPINDNGDAFYDYRLADTQVVAGRRLLHLIFIPKRQGQNTFTGDCWVHDSTYAIQKVILHINQEANVNYVDKLSIVQEFKLINDSTWFLSKDKFIVNLNPLGNKAMGFIARKTTNYNNVRLNNNANLQELTKNKVAEEVVVLPEVKNKPVGYWDTARVEPLTVSEKGIYVMVDSLMNSPAYKKLFNLFFFLGTGYKNIGKIQIGPWYSWMSGNAWEGKRFRFDLSSTLKFSKKFWLHGYLAYGTLDKNFKGQAETRILLKHEPFRFINASYSNDLSFKQDYGRSDISGDNFFAVAIRKQGVPTKYLNLQEMRIDYFRDTRSGFSSTLSFTNKQFTPLLNIPDKTYFPVKQGQPMNTTELIFKLRYAYDEKLYVANFFRYYVGSPGTVAEMEFTQGLKGILNSSYNYEKLTAGINSIVSVAPYGKLYFNIYGGKIFGTLPYTLLELHPGNDVYYYNKYAFNLMNKYEFLSDKYLGLSLEHNFGNGLFKYIGLTRKMKLRQFWNMKAITGSLSDKNKTLNFVGNYSFKALDNKFYLEAGTGIDNIFKMFRLDFVWRLAPTPLPSNQSSRFGVFGSFHVKL